ncbi:hypothetical protein CJ030_MR2G028954 [Morella rubra]|uniref:Uncharacterized protein n=1 Tax=Morella rubra TaxID=262757 RepID=A0A6A1WDJ4_9ROSI|nr:hypothetical protein CJ030_MR2G028954 [Morella rubra]
MLVDVVVLISWGEHLRLVHVVDVDGLQDLGLYEVADLSLGYHWDVHSVLDLLDQLRITHSGHPTLSPNICLHALQCHHGACSRLLSDTGLLRVHHVHDNPTTQHLGQAYLDREWRFLGHLVEGYVTVNGDNSGVSHPDSQNFVNGQEKERKRE